MTNRDVIRRALQMISVMDSGETEPAAEDSVLGVEQMNSVFDDLMTDGVDLGYPRQDDPEDDFPLEERIATLIEPILACRLHAFFPASQLTPKVEILADQNERRLLRDAINTSAQESSLSHIPLGNNGGFVDITRG